MYGSASAVLIARLPRVVVDFPAEDDALAAVLVVRLEHELVAWSAMYGSRSIVVAVVRSSVAPRRRASTESTRSIASLLLVVEQVGVALVVQHREARLLVQDLAARRIDHAHLAVAHRAQDRMIDARRARPAR